MNLIPDRPWEWARGIDPARPNHSMTVGYAFASCWHASPYENAHLWHVYGQNGVAIQTTFGNLTASLVGDQTFYGGAVTYIDYEHDSFPADNAFHTLMHKRKYFEADHEVRLIAPGVPPDDELGWVGDQRQGFEIAAERETLIGSVRVSPQAGTYVRDAVQAVLDRFGLDLTVEQSGLDDPPRF
ncbi:MAG: hypothetical protein U0R50_12995 [Gaiellales bacterium]